MIRSMTGYGEASADLADVRVEVVLRSVNHRYADLRLRIPPALAASESRLRRQILSGVRRGRVEASIEILPHAGSEPRPQLNRPLVDAVFHAATVMREEYGIAGLPDLPAVLAVPGLFRPAAEDRPWDEGRVAELDDVVARALAALDGERVREGRHLAEEMHARLVVMQELARQIAGHADSQPAAVRDRLLARLGALAPEVQLDPARLAQEAVLLADRCDVTEERVRLDGHLEQSRALVERPDGEPLGKRLEFLLQEIHRETNTINSKSVSLELSRLALTLKSEVEKLREQVQNLE
jgi:uncharacterized protein (TIGR00255 family)